MTMMMCPSNLCSCLIIGLVSTGFIVMLVEVSWVGLVEVVELVKSDRRSFCTDSSSISLALMSFCPVLCLFLSEGLGEGLGGLALL